MAQQKLYTEEQVRQAMQESRYAYCTDKGYDDILNELTPIEVPTDEEIWNESNKDENFSNDLQFLRGAEWMRNKILNK